MLFLTRRVGETLMLGEDMTITVLDVEGTQVPVGIQALENLSVSREETYERLKLERHRTAQGDPRRPSRRRALRRLRSTIFSLPLEPKDIGQEDALWSFLNFAH